MGSYSFQNVAASLTGPGAGNIQLGAGAGAAEEGISYAMDGDKDTTTTGADGAIMHSLHAGQTGTITVRLLKTSPVNALLMNLYNAQRASSNLWGNNTIRVSDVIRGDVLDGSSLAFVKQPDDTWAVDANTIEWQFKGIVRLLLGAGQADLSLP